MPTAIPDIRLPEAPGINNALMNALNIRGARDQQSQVRNAAVLRQKEMENKKHVESGEYALNLLTGVTGAEDLDKAKRIFAAKYPDMSEMFNKMLPYYDERSIELISNSIRTETQKMKVLERGDPAEVKGYAPDTTLMQGTEMIGRTGPATPKVATPPTPSWEVFEGVEGDQIYVQKGKPIPDGYNKVRGGSGTSLTINTGDISKTTKAKLEATIMEGTRNIQSFTETRKLFKPEYLTTFNKANKFIAEAADKAGVSTKGQKAFIRERAMWFRQAKADFIAYRKWATGVAGGEKELQEIATSFPDPVKNSPTQYAANLDNIEETTKRVLMMNAEFLRSGIDTEQPLDAILKQAKGMGIAVPGGTGGTPAGGGGSVTIKFDAQGNRLP